MNPIFDTQAPKRPTNVSVNGDLLAKARALEINLSATLESALVERVAERQRELWLRENEAAVEAYNRLVEEGGVFGDDLRRF